MKKLRKVTQDAVTVSLYLEEEKVPKILKIQAKKGEPYVVRVASVKFAREYAKKMVKVSWWYRAVVRNKYGEVVADVR